MTIPFNALDRELTRILKAALSVPVEDHPDLGTPMPFVVPGDYDAVADDTKTDEDERVIVEIEVFSEYKGKKELNTLLEQVRLALLAPGTPIDLSAEGLECWGRRFLGARTTREKDQAKVFRHGFVRFEFRIGDA